MALLPSPIDPLSWPTSSTNGIAWSPTFAAGPYWSSFEKLRTAGSTAVESIGPGVVATLQTRSASYRVLRDEDFQRLLGLASEVHRLKGGITIILQAARLVAKHKDRESVDMLMESVSMLNESSVLPERDGHDQFEITQEELAENSGDDIDLATIRRPSL